MLPKNFGLIVVLVCVLLLVLYFWHTSENFSEVFYLDQMAMKYSDPMYFKYSSWERDVDGMSPRDYYLENQTNYLNQIAPGYFEKDGLYVDHTDYLNMPPQNRPNNISLKPISAAAPEILIQKKAGMEAEKTALENAEDEGYY
jgi:hypothetical protein